MLTLTAIQLTLIVVVSIIDIFIPMTSSYPVASSETPASSTAPVPEEVPAPAPVAPTTGQKIKIEIDAVELPSAFQTTVNGMSQEEKFRQKTDLMNEIRDLATRHNVISTAHSKEESRIKKEADARAKAVATAKTKALATAQRERNINVIVEFASGATINIDIARNSTVKDLKEEAGVQHPEFRALTHKTKKEKFLLDTVLVFGGNAYSGKNARATLGKALGMDNNDRAFVFTPTEFQTHQAAVAQPIAPAPVVEDVADDETTVIGETEVPEGQ